MLTPNLASVDLSLLETVCSNAWPESPTLEFKRETPGTSDKDKHELLKDVCALANADGGDIVFGVHESNGSASQLSPIISEPVDALTRRLIQTIESGIEPRLVGLQIAHIVAKDGYVLILRVPASYLGPHCFKVNNSRRFVMRNGTSTSDLTFDQLRMAFDRTASLGERARSFIRERNLALEDRATPKPLIAGPIKAVHFVPLSGLAGKQTPDLQAVYSQSYTTLLGIDWGGGSRVFNLDGLVVYPGGAPSEGHYGYVQVFRTGAMEAASLGGGTFQTHPTMPERLLVWSLDMTKFYRERTATFLAFAKSQGLAGPAVISFSMLHVEGFELGIDSFLPRRIAPIADRTHLIAPEVWVDNLESTEVDDIARPLLDTLWQGFGMERCIDYDPSSGEYKPRQR